MGSVNNNKEFFELLNNTDSNSGSEIQQLVIPPRKKRFRRKLRNNPNIRHEEDGHLCHCSARSVSLTVFCLVLLCWLITLTWLAVVLHQEMFRLNTDFDQSVPAVSVPLRGGKKMKKRKELDALVAHTVSKRASGTGVSSHEQLLTDSSDEWTPGVGNAARCRRRSAARRRVCSALTRACSVLLIFTCAVGTTTVMWLFIDVRQQVTSLRTELTQVVAAHKGVPDALQECHSLSRELHKNQSAIMNKLVGFSLLMGNFSTNLSDVRTALAVVQEQLKTSPSLVNDPRLVKDLSESVAKFGSKIQDLETTATSLKEQDSKHETVLTSLISNLTDLHSQVASLAGDRGGVSASELTAQKDAIMQTIGQLIVNVTKINETLAGKLKWTADDEAMDHTKVENLREMNENITARLQTLEGLCMKSTADSVAAAPAPASPAPSDAAVPLPTKYNSLPSLFTTHTAAAVEDKENVSPSAQKLSAPSSGQ